MSYEEEKQDRKIEQLEAEIERLRAELAKVNQTRETEIDQAGAAERMYLEGVRAKDVRIKELEDALVEERARRRHATERGSSCKYHKECEQEDLNFCDFDGCPHKIDYFMKKACQRLQAEGKIGPEDAKPRSWQITDERILAIENAISSCVLIERYTGLDLQHETAALRAMLEEAGQ